MNFNEEKFSRYGRNTPFPFYMNYWSYRNQQKDENVLRDLEYFQLTYPAEVRQYQQRIAEILDQLDYEGSMIYDEYPDKGSIMRMAENITDILSREQEEEWPGESLLEGATSWIQVLLCNEIYKRRRGGRRGRMLF